jgi:hypothetical protein
MEFWWRMGANFEIQKLEISITGVDLFGRSRLQCRVSTSVLSQKRRQIGGNFLTDFDNKKAMISEWENIFSRLNQI